jgi:small subunit ribosomal protein S6
MRRYETIIIIDPDLSEEERKPLMSRLEDLIPQQGGLLVVADEWGNRRLAYKIKKKNRGYYVRMDYCGTSALVSEMERFLGIDDRALKYMTVLVDAEVDMDGIKEEIARMAAKEEPAAPEVAPEVADDAKAEDTESNKAEVDNANSVDSPDDSPDDSNDTGGEPETEASAEVSNDAGDKPEAEAAEIRTPDTETKKEEL